MLVHFFDILGNEDSESPAPRQFYNEKQGDWKQKQFRFVLIRIIIRRRVLHIIGMLQLVMRVGHNASNADCRKKSFGKPAAADSYYATYLAGVTVRTKCQKPHPRPLRATFPRTQRTGT